MWIPFAKGSEIPLAGRNFYGGARGNLPYVRSPRFQRGEYGPAERKALSSALVGLKPSLNLVPPRPLQFNRLRQTFVCRGYGLAEPLFRSPRCASRVRSANL